MELQGFERATSEVKPRLIVSVEGLEKKGKTHFALTAPGPLALLNLDMGDEGVVKKFVDSKLIFKQDYRRNRRMEQKDHQKLWEQLKSDFYTALDHPEIRTIILDTATDIWELCRLAVLGRLSQVQPFQYGEANEEFKDLFKEAIGSNKNVILLHQVKKEYANNQPTGDYERAGFSKVGYLVQVLIKMTTKDLMTEDGKTFDRRQFGFRIMDCRHDPALNGLELTDDFCNFTNLAMALFPDTDEEYWA